MVNPRLHPARRPARDFGGPAEIRTTSRALDDKAPPPLALVALNLLEIPNRPAAQPREWLRERRIDRRTTRGDRSLRDAKQSGNFIKAAEAEVSQTAIAHSEDDVLALRRSRCRAMRACEARWKSQ